jgi:hypothetical protein
MHLPWRRVRTRIIACQEKSDGAPGRTRTSTPFGNLILSQARLPISPQRHLCWPAPVNGRAARRHISQRPALGKHCDAAPCRLRPARAKAGGRRWSFFLCSSVPVLPQRIYAKLTKFDGVFEAMKTHTILLNYRDLSVIRGLLPRSCLDVATRQKLLFGQAV